MNTIIEDNELDTELQELHLLSTNWISELQFLRGELNFLKKLTNQRLKKKIKEENPEKACQIDNNMATLEASLDTVGNEIMKHLRYLEGLIVDPSQPFALSIIKDHAELEYKINEDFRLIRSCKKDLFSLVSQ